MCLWGLDSYRGWAFASEPCLSCLPLILGTVAAHCLYFLVLVIFLAASWLLVGWRGGNGTCDVALLPSSCSHLNEKTCILMVTHSSVFMSLIAVPPCTQLSSAISYCFNPLFSSGALTHRQTHLDKSWYFCYKYFCTYSLNGKVELKFAITMVYFGHLAFCWYMTI